jgi:hypothetical protein
MNMSRRCRRTAPPLCALVSGVSILLAGGCGRTANDAERVLSFASDTVAVIGVLDGADHEVFGRLGAAAVQGGLGVVLLDEQAGAALWYDLDGAFRGRLGGGRGQGPGDLNMPIAVHAGADSTLWILDRENVRISQFTVQASGTISYTGSLAGGFPDGSVCRLRGRLFEAGLRSGALLHELSEAGTVGSWGTAPEIDGIESAGEWRFAAEPQVLQGKVLCAEDSETIVMALASHPLVRAFDAGGAVRWETRLTEFTPVGFTVDPNGRLRPAIDAENGAYFLKSIVPWNDGTVLIQYEVRMRGPRPENADFHGVDSRLLDLATGAELASSRDLPRIAARSGDHVVVIANTPYPRAVIVRAKDSN